MRNPHLAEIRRSRPPERAKPAVTSGFHSTNNGGGGGNRKRGSVIRKPQWLRCFARDCAELDVVFEDCGCGCLAVVRGALGALCPGVFGGGDLVPKVGIWRRVAGWAGTRRLWAHAGAWSGLLRRSVRWDRAGNWEGVADGKGLCSAAASRWVQQGSAGISMSAAPAFATLVDALVNQLPVGNTGQPRPTSGRQVCGHGRLA